MDATRSRTPRIPGDWPAPDAGCRGTHRPSPPTRGSPRTETTPRFVLADLETAIAAADIRIAACQAEALRVVATDEGLTKGHTALCSIKGIADRAAVQIGAELALLDRTMTSDEVVAHAGLDPRPFQSGTLDGARRTSKVGNARLRACLYFPTLTALTHNAPVKEAYDRLVAAGKLRAVAVTAISRRLLRACWVVYRSGQLWCDERFRPKPPRATGQMVECQADAKDTAVPCT